MKFDWKLMEFPESINNALLLFYVFPSLSYFCLLIANTKNPPTESIPVGLEETQE